MYEDFYGLSENPFSLTPSSRYIFQSRRYQVVVEEVLSGLAQGPGIVAVAGAPGMGKTTLCFDLPTRLDPARYRTAVIFDPFLDVEAMLQALLTEFGRTYPEGAPATDLLERLRRFLLACRTDGLTCVAIFDESQHLAPEVLTQVVALAVAEGEDAASLRIVLAGPPEPDKESQQPLPGLPDRWKPARCTLTNLDADEVAAYIHHRLTVAGAENRVQFTADALDLVFQATGGVPRSVNQTCDRALLAGYVAKAPRIRRQHVEQGMAFMAEHDPVDTATGDR